MDATTVDLGSILANAQAIGPVWTQTSDDLNVNLLRFDGGRGVPAHRNDAVDVLLYVVEGDGIVEIEGIPQQLHAGQLCLIPKGLTRSIRSAGRPFAYLSCHRRRAGLWPA